MSQFSPNLKPKSLHNHTDKAHYLGVPRSNVVDLRKQVQESEAKAALEIANETNREQKVSWWKKRQLAKQQRTISEQRKTEVSIHRENVTAGAQPVVTEPAAQPAQFGVLPDELTGADNLPREEIQEELIAAPVPEEAKIHQSALHEEVDYDETAEQHEAERSAVLAERALIRQQKAEAKQLQIAAKRKAKEDMLLARQRSKEAARAEAERERQAALESRQMEKAKRLKEKSSSSSRSNAAVRFFGALLQQTVRSLAVFALMLGVLVAPFAALGFYKHVSKIRDAVVEVSQEAVGHLQNGGQSANALDFLSAQESFGSASTNFKDAHDELLSVSSVMTPIVRVIPEAGDQFNSAENILIAGEQISAAGEDVAKAFTILSDLDVANSIDSASNTSLTDTLVIAHSALRPALPRLELASLALAEVDVDYVPEEYREDLAFAKEVIPQIEASVRQLFELSETMLVILGHDESKRYLVLFQNSAEMRPTGGFIGSFAVVDINQGRVSNLEIPHGGPYDLLNDISYKIQSPTPLHFVNPHWQMQDANWWPHVPSSFQLVQKMYRKQGGSSVDGVISLTPEVIEQMLELTGPIEMPDYVGTLPTENEVVSTDDSEDSVVEEAVTEIADAAANSTLLDEDLASETVEITADNFYRYTQEQAERKFDDTNESKKFISDLTPKILDRLFNLEADNFLPVMQLFYNSLNEKDILLYFNDAFIQDEMSQRGWTGEVESTANDYLQVVDTNIAGGKTNRVISKVINHQAQVQSDGKIIVTTTVTWTHNGQSDDDLESVKNLNYVRFYVPAGSQLINAEGFMQPNPKLMLDADPDYEYSEDLQAISGDILIDEATQMRINNEFNKTVFGNFVETVPGETSHVVVQYILPFTIEIDNLFNPADAYSLLVQKQPGDFDPLVLSSLLYPDDYKIRWSYPATKAHATGDGIQNEVTLINAELKQDVFVGIVLEQ